ncbi:MAG: ABC transporter permease [Treponema sp.]|nr:ABC transporter permease [Treponema sp.]
MFPQAAGGGDLKIKSQAPTGGPSDNSNRFTDSSPSVSNNAFLFIVPVIALLVLALIVFFVSESPLRTLYFFFTGPFRNIFSFGNMLNNTVPLILGALGITVAMKAGCLNLGGEGQIYLGAFTAAAVALALSKFGVIAIILASLAGMITASAMAAFCGFCKAKWNANELISTFLLSCAVIPVVNFLVTGPFLDPETSLQSTRKIAENMRFPLILKPSNLSAGVFIAIAFAALVWFFLAKTRTGYELRMTGSNELFARYGGINTKLNTVTAMAISGGLYGLAGSLMVFGTYHAVIKEFSAGIGWNGLAVALIAGFHPYAVIPAAVFFAWIGAGARIAMQNTGLTYEVASIVQSVILFLSTSLVLRNFMKRRKIKK